MRILLGQDMAKQPADDPPLDPVTEVLVPLPTDAPKTEPEDGNNPFLKFIEEMTQLKKQYASVATNVYSMNEVIKAHSTQIGARATNATFPPDTSTSVTVLGFQFFLNSQNFLYIAAFLFLLIVQVWVLILLYSNRGVQNTPVAWNQIRLSAAPNHARKAHLVQSPFKKRAHGIWKPKLRRPAFYNYFKEPLHSAVPTGSPFVEKNLFPKEDIPVKEELDDALAIGK